MRRLQRSKPKPTLVVVIIVVVIVFALCCTVVAAAAAAAVDLPPNEVDGKETSAVLVEDLNLDDLLLSDSLQMVQKLLQQRQLKHNRPADIHEMTEEQLVAEKSDVKQVLRVCERGRESMCQAEASRSHILGTKQTKLRADCGSLQKISIEAVHGLQSAALKGWRCYPVD